VSPELEQAIRELLSITFEGKGAALRVLAARRKVALAYLGPDKCKVALKEAFIEPAPGR
jgi:hypothetical protein